MVHNILQVLVYYVVLSYVRAYIHAFTCACTFAYRYHVVFVRVYTDLDIQLNEGVPGPPPAPHQLSRVLHSIFVEFAHVVVNYLLKSFQRPFDTRLNLLCFNSPNTIGQSLGHPVTTLRTRVAKAFSKSNDLAADRIRSAV